MPAKMGSGALMPRAPAQPTVSAGLPPAWQMDSNLFCLPCSRTSLHPAGFGLELLKDTGG